MRHRRKNGAGNVRPSDTGSDSPAATPLEMGGRQNEAHPRPLCVRVPMAAKMLGIGSTKLYELIANGQLQTIKLGRVTLVPIASLEQLIADNVSSG